jgi:hypothetical protein
MSIQNCLARLVQANRISQKAADDALALHEAFRAGSIRRWGQPLLMLPARSRRPA